MAWQKYLGRQVFEATREAQYDQTYKKTSSLLFVQALKVS